MKPQDNSPVVLLKVFFITALMAVMGFTYISPFFEATPHADSTPKVLVYEVQESLGDAESITPDTNLGAFFTNFMLVFASILLVTLHSRKEVATRLTFLYHIRPRSPPTP